ncbi:MAG TPA: hypothetical protein VNK95_17805 [Caldilineaceae bacterium]|nr:hypothetical protein [Caldilineaceae bacterium]
MSRIHALLAAGSLTGLVLAALFWWGGGSLSSRAEAVTAAAPISSAAEPTVTPDLPLLLDQNRQLRETVKALLARETEYRQQIEAANQQLLAAQQGMSGRAGEVGGATAAPAEEGWGNDHSDNEHESDDHENDDQENDDQENDDQENDDHAEHESGEHEDD